MTSCIIVCLCYFVFYYVFFFFKQKTAYDMRISDWSSDVCSSDLVVGLRRRIAENMAESKRHIPHFSYVEESDVSALEALRGEKIGRASCRERVCQYV